MGVDRISPDELGRNSHGWISPEGAIYSGSDEHSALVNEILEKYDEVVGIGWIRYLTYPRKNKTTLAFDWTGDLYTDESEGIARQIAKRVSYPYDLVECDYGKWKNWWGPIDDFIKFGVSGRRTTLESYYSLEIETVKPDDIGHVAKRGWISPDGVIYSGQGEHDSILQRIFKPGRPGPRSGWIRWIASVSGTFFLDWSEFGNDQSENLARAIAKQVSYPFDRVWIDAPNWVSWKGPVDDFVKFGVKGRRQQFESRLDRLLAAL